MLKSAVTISLVEQARGGPFVYWDDLAGSIKSAAALGYDAVELFAPGPEAVDRPALKQWLEAARLGLAAVGTGAGWVIHRLSLTDPDPAAREKAKQFIASIINLGGPFGAPAIIGSMQGRWGGDVDRETALGYLGDAMAELEQVAAGHGVPLIYEPLNRYETNLCNTMQDGVSLLESRGLTNVKLLADLFHMNIEETDIGQAISDAGAHIGHIHFVDSNRRPAGCGHMDYGPIMSAIGDSGYAGYLSAEAFPWPDPESAARQTMEAFTRLTASN